VQIIDFGSERDGGDESSHRDQLAGAQQAGQRLRVLGSVFTRSFGRRGIEDGEITMQSMPTFARYR